ncbi:DUF3489 domain-containing protein [Sphingomonas profundi]|uniref:DUF3489 domain-containing protein n=1 Tax=Alterirhizorhabdus profundi TaxID=2681549 RepID=UPI0012E83598|nr:DUF3489 domain-containing protein [Sphingomonas profundi]
MTSKLTDMQLILLATACQREDGSLLPPPATLGEQAARIRRAVTALIKRTFASECEMADTAKAWREQGDRHIGVIITDAGRAVIAAEQPEATPGTSKTGTESTAEPEPATAAAESPVQRTGTKQSLVLDLLRREDGANIDDLMAATGWLPHTTRAALTGLRKKGHAIMRVGESGASRYRLEANA